MGRGDLYTAGGGINCTITLESNHIHSRLTHGYILPEN